MESSKRSKNGWNPFLIGRFPRSISSDHFCSYSVRCVVFLATYCITRKKKLNLLSPIKMSIDTQSLKSSELGKVVLFYTKCKRVDPTIKRLADNLVSKSILTIPFIHHV